MPLNVTPSTSNSQQPGGPAKYVPTRNTPGMAPNTAPIDERSMPPGTNPGAAAGAPGADEHAPGGEQDGEEGRPESWRFAKLAEKDKAARDRLDRAKAAEAALKTRQDELAQREASLKAEEDRRAAWKRNPAQLLRDHGFVPEAALQFMLSGEKLTPEQELAMRVDQRVEEATRKSAEEVERLRQEQLEREQQRDEEARRQERAELAEQERAAVDELHGDIAEVVTGDAKAFPLLQRSGERAAPAVFKRLSEISEKQMKETGRRPPITTKMIERAAAEVEAAARAELQEALADQNVAASLGVGRVAPPRAQRQLTNAMPTRQSVTEETPGQETEQQKRDRVTGMIRDSWRRRGGQ